MVRDGVVSNNNNNNNNNNNIVAAAVQSHINGRNYGCADQWHVQNFIKQPMPF